MNPNQVYAYLGADVVIRNPSGQSQQQQQQRRDDNDDRRNRGWGDRNRQNWNDRRWRPQEREHWDRFNQRPAFFQQDYTFINDRGWRPRWFPYWDPYWAQYWDYLYSYYGGYANAAYAEQMRDQYLRSIAAQQGWR